MSIAKALTNEFRHEAAATRGMLEKAPEEKFGWQPHERSMTLGRLVGHIAEGHGWIDRIMEQEGLDFAADNGFERIDAKSTAELLEVYDREVEAFCDAIARYTDDDFMVTWTLRKGDQVLGQMPRLSVIRSFVLNHHYHHRGQLSVYLRLLDVALPMIYGPTADEQGGFG